MNNEILKRFLMSALLIVAAEALSVGAFLPVARAQLLSRGDLFWPGRTTTACWN